MTPTLGELVASAELDQLAEACRRLRLDDDEIASVLARYRASPGLLDLVLLHGGDAGEFVRARLEIRRAIRAGG